MALITEIPSPFCGIGTDDLSIQVDGVALKVMANGCAVNTPAFEQVIGDTNPRIAGKTVSFQEAVIKAAALLADTKQPMIGGCATDVNGMRALLHEIATNDPNLAVRRLGIVVLKNGSPQRETILLLNGLADDDEQDGELRKTARAVAIALQKRANTK